MAEQMDANELISRLLDVNGVPAAKEVIEQCAAQPLEVQRTIVKAAEAKLVGRALGSFSDADKRARITERADELRAIRLNYGDMVANVMMGGVDKNPAISRLMLLGMMMDYIATVKPYAEQQDFTRFYNDALRKMPEETWSHVETHMTIVCKAVACQLREIDPPPPPPRKNTPQMGAGKFSF